MRKEKITLNDLTNFQKYIKGLKRVIRHCDPANRYITSNRTERDKRERIKEKGRKKRQGERERGIEKRQGERRIERKRDREIERIKDTEK